MDDSERLAGRGLRRHAGLVTEDIYSSEGMIRLRRRDTPIPAAGSIDDICALRRLHPADFEIIDGRISPHNLISLEGNTRALGHLRMFGTRLELRREDGLEAGVPLYLRRAPSVEGQQLEIVLGEHETPVNRLAIGTASHFGPLETKVVVQAEGLTGMGTIAPGDYAPEANRLVIADEVSDGLTIASPSNAHGSVYFADGTTQAEWARGLLRYEHNNDALVLGSAGEPRVWINHQGRVGVGTSTPSGGVQITAGQSVSLANGSGRLVLNEVNQRNLVMDGNELQARNNGAASVLHLNARGGEVRIHNNLTDQEKVVVTEAGQVGIGTSAPDTALHIKGVDPDLRLDIDSSSPNELCEIRFSEDGATQANLFWNRTDRRLYLRNGTDVPISLDGPDLGIGLGFGSAPETRLHVRDSINASATNPDAHVALIENSSTQVNADVLALRVATPLAGPSNNFITFFDGSGAIGAIEGNGGGVSLNTAGADFAEMLPLGDDADEIGPGEVVGLFGGQISRRTEGADAVMVTSTRPAVLGNADPETKAKCVGVTLLGQAPVNVTGPVVPGDVLVASGRNDGRAHAVTACRLNPDLLSKVIGRAWSGAADGQAVVAVGMNGTLAAELLDQARSADEARMSRLEAEIAELRRLISKPEPEPQEERNERPDSAS
jgi:hypothetical protein